MFITPAFAQAAEPAAGNPLSLFIPMIAILGIMYFLVLRPQQKRLREHREMVAALRRGDIVVTAGGVIGKVVKVSGDSELLVEIADNVRIRVVKGTIAEVRTKTEPVHNRPKDEEPDESGDEEKDAEETADSSQKPVSQNRVTTAAASNKPAARQASFRKAKNPLPKRRDKAASESSAPANQPTVVRENGTIAPNGVKPDEPQKEA